MKGLLIDVHNAKIQEVEVSELDDYYKWMKFCMDFPMKN